MYRSHQRQHAERRRSRRTPLDVQGMSLPRSSTANLMSALALHPIKSHAGNCAGKVVTRREGLGCKASIARGGRSLKNSQLAGIESLGE